MNCPRTQDIEQILSGRQRGVGPMMLRAMLSAAEPFYAGVMLLRNRLYDAGVLKAHRLPVPVISVGNITAGGTGKTPIVRWLTQRLHRVGMHPAILMRGYKRDDNAVSDEQAVLQESLSNNDGGVIVHAEPNRVAGGAAVLREHADVNVFVLDDGFQHRRLHRDFDLVLIDATQPFGFGHVHPRGLLREPLSGLKRADAFILTRSDQIDVEPRKRLEDELRGHNHRAPVYLAKHVHAGLRSAGSQGTNPADAPLDILAQRPFFAFAGIGRPESLHRQLQAFSATYRAHCWFDDHHHYSDSDLQSIRQKAAAAGAEILLTTEKDWVKVRNLAAAHDSNLPIYRLDLQIAMEPRAEQGLIDLIRARIEKD